MIGVEEEFFILDEETLFPTSATPKLILKLVKKNGCYFTKSTMESPIDKESFKVGFPIIELKTSPHKDLDCLLDEIRHHRGTLGDVASEEHLLILPSGLHPAHDPRRNSRLLCCALHVHVSGYPLKKAFFALANHVPELIALTANSPFLNGKTHGKTMRTLYSYAIGVPTDFYKRASDLIINRKLGTVELRVCDTQVVTKDVFNLVHVILGIIDSHCEAETKLGRDLERERFMAAIGGKSALKSEVKELYEGILPSLSEFGTAKTVYEYLMNESPPADFQIKVAKRYGISNVIESLWASFQGDKLKVSNRLRNVRMNYAKKLKNLPYFFLYLPVHLFNLSKKFVQDDMIRTWILAGNSHGPSLTYEDCW